MRHIKVIITREWNCHGMTMEQAIAHAMDKLQNEPSRVEITAHDVFTEEESSE